jgi:hypothetical protein
LAFDDLDAPPVVVGARNWITPAAELEDAFFPTLPGARERSLFANGSCVDGLPLAMFRSAC